MSHEQQLKIIELDKKIIELETKVTMYEQYIRMLESHIDKFDANLKLSIQRPACSSTGKPLHTSFIFNNKLFPTLELNLESLDKAKLQKLLAVHAPSYASIVQILEHALNGPHTESPLIKTTTSTFCSYMADSGETKMESLSNVFDKICSIVYNKCQSVIEFVDIDCDTEFNESEHSNMNNTYNNIMLLHNPKSKAKILKELSPIFR
tara:strand:- start:885 stop:1505 length:621 start_codon:yes stop_codon:yes gene_type:complete